MVMAATGISDIELIRDTMDTFGHDMDSVYNYLFSALESDQTLGETAPNFHQTNEPQNEVEKPAE